MKTLQKQVDIIWRFRCERCRSKFEMTNEEKLDNDWKYNESSVHKDRNEPGAVPINHMEYFDCPVCNTRRYVRRGEMHKFMLMDDGTEFQEY